MKRNIAITAMMIICLMFLVHCGSKKKAVGSPCQRDEDCADGLCLNSKCALPGEVGDSCTRDEECQSKNCLYGICQDASEKEAAVYDLSHEISLSTDTGSVKGMVKTYNYDVTISEGDKTFSATYQSENQNLETITIDMQKINTQTGNTETVSKTLTCQKIKHHVTIVTNTLYDPLQDVDMTVWMPTVLETPSPTMFFYFDKIEVVEGNTTSTFSYYYQQPETNVVYAPVITNEDLFDRYEPLLFGLYGFGLTLFQSWIANLNALVKLQDGQTITTGSGMYSIKTGTKKIGAFTLKTYTIEITAEGGGQKVVLSPSLPLLLEIHVTGSGGTDSTEDYQYTLTDLVLEPVK